MTSTDSFDLFGLPRLYKIDLVVLEHKWKTIAAQVHPDRFASASAAEKRVAVQWSARVNEAYRILKDPVKRAQHLCALAGFEHDERTQPSMNIDFLENQMAWRESLERARLNRHADDLRALQSSVLEASNTYECLVGDLLDQQQWQTASDRLSEWMFIQKFSQEVTQAMRVTRDHDRNRESQT